MCACRFAVAMSLLSVGSAPAQNRLDTFGDPLPKGAVQRLGTIRLRHAENIGAVVFSSNGRFRASAGHDQIIRLWHPTTGALLKELTGHKGVVTARWLSHPTTSILLRQQHGTKTRLCACGILIRAKKCIASPVPKEVFTPLRFLPRASSLQQAEGTVGCACGKRPPATR